MKKKQLLLMSLFLASSFTITGCGYHSYDNGPAQQSVEKYVVSGSISDPSEGLISGSVTLSAVDKNGAVVKLYSDKTGGTQITTVIANLGLISFYVDSTAVLPVTVTVVANAPGRVSSSATVSIAKAGQSTFAIKLVDTTSTTTPGVTSGTANVTASASTGLAAPLTTTVTTTDPTKTGAEVSIPASAILKDSTGAALSGTVTATVTTFAPPTSNNPIDETSVTTALSLANFPGGLGNALIASASPQTPAVAGSFATAGFVAVNLTDASGKQATTSSIPFTIRMDIPAGTINPQTGSALVADGVTSIPIWTYNEKDAVWKAEIDANGNQINGLVKLDAQGLYVEFTTNHFSYWNLDWHYSDTCNATLNLTNDAKSISAYLAATFTNGAGYLYEGYKPSGEGTVSAARVPKNKMISLYLKNTSGTVIAMKENFDWCAQPGSSITLDYTAPPAQKPVPVKVTVNEYCEQDSSVTRVVPSTQTYAIVGNSVSSGTTLADGSYTYNLIPAGGYKFYIWNRTTHKYSTQNLPISAARTVAFSSPVQCTVITGTTGSGSGGVTFE